MADTAFSTTPVAGKKRSRDDGDDTDELGRAFDYMPRLEKKARPTSADSNPWPNDSVLNTPTNSLKQNAASGPAYQMPTYDSDGGHSSMISEPGSPQDIAMSSGDDDDMVEDLPALSQSPEGFRLRGSSPWQHRMQTTRVATPILPPPTRPGARPMQVGAKQHIRRRHPQEITSGFSSDHLEVPSPTDEDEVPTPPSAAEAAGSQLSMLTVNDMDVELPGVPAITRLDRLGREDRASPRRLVTDFSNAMDEDPDPSGAPESGGLLVRKQRQRSGALSEGNGLKSSPSPVRGAPEQLQNAMGVGGKRGFSMGFRADCEKCRMRVPGHMNHFIG